MTPRSLPWYNFNGRKSSYIPDTGERGTGMKTIEEYMRLKYRMELIPDEAEGGYTVRYPDLPGA